MDMVKAKEIFRQNWKLILIISLWTICTVLAFRNDDTSYIWLFDMGIVFLLYRAWKYRKDSSVMIPFISLAIIFSIFAIEWDTTFQVLYVVFLSPSFISLLFDRFVGMHMEKGIKRFVLGCMPGVILLLSLYWYEDLNAHYYRKEIIFSLFVIAVASAVYNMSGIEKKSKNIILWCTAVFSWIITYNYMVCDPGYFENIWEMLFLAALPIIYTVVFRKISDFFAGKSEKSYMRTTAGYFIFCLAVFGVTGGFIYQRHSRWTWAPDKGFYIVLLALIVYLIEAKNMDVPVEKKNRIRAFTCGSLYTAAAGVLTFFGNERLRIVIFNMGGPAVNISEGTRENWFSYRSGLINQFLSGNLEDMDNYMNYTPIGRLAARLGYVSLIIAALLILTLALLLVFRKWEDRELNRIKNYLAISYLIRGGIVILYCVLVLPVSRLAFPFFSFYGIVFDVMILHYLFKENRMRKAKT